MPSRGVRVAVAMLVAVLAAGAWVADYVYRPLHLEHAPVEFSVHQGATLRTASRLLVAAGVLPDAWRFELLGRVAGVATSVKAGNFIVERGTSALELLRMITGDAYRLDAIVFVEGWTFRQVRAALDAHPSLRHETAGKQDVDVLRLVGIDDYEHPEGLFFPDRYHFAKGESDVSVLRRASHRMQQILHEQWAQRRSDLPLESPYEALVLASIVEKETGRDGDRALIAAVFANRLRSGMRLQADPTVIYGLGAAFDGDLRREHLRRDTPYNTYTRVGLPPTPIALPGLASIAAAVRPAASRALYFVARGDGTSHFSESLVEHNRAVQRFQRGAERRP